MAGGTQRHAASPLTGEVFANGVKFNVQLPVAAAAAPVIADGFALGFE